MLGKISLLLVVHGLLFSLVASPQLHNANQTASEIITKRIPTNGSSSVVANFPIYLPAPVVQNNNLPVPKEDPKSFWEKYSPFTAALVTAIIAGLVSLYAFVIYPSNLKKLELRLNYVELQLRDLYGPLLGECIQADGMFRRLELALVQLGAEDHRHYDFREIVVGDFKATISSYANTGEDRRRVFARVLAEIYVPANQRRVDLLQKNLHLLGPRPPLSFFLFLTHAAQLRSLVSIKQLIDLRIEDHDTLDRYEDPYILMPFPTAMTAEVVAKVALLKALQNEYRYRIGGSSFGIPGEVFFRDQYFLLLDDDLRDKLGYATDPRNSQRDARQRAHYAVTCPLVWGPYTAVELFDLRSWLITKELPMRGFPGLEGEHLFVVAMLKADVAQICPDNLPDRVIRPLHHRVAQAFDELDVPGSKMNHPWDEEFEWEDLAQGKTQLTSFRKCGYSLQHLPPAPQIAYRVRPYSKMREIPLEPAEASKSFAMRFREWREKGRDSRRER